MIALYYHGYDANDNIGVQGHHSVNTETKLDYFVGLVERRMQLGDIIKRWMIITVYPDGRVVKNEGKR